MLNILLATLVAMTVYWLVAWAFGPIAAFIPSLIVLIIALVLLMRRTSRQVQAALEQAMQLLQARRVDEARKLLFEVKRRYRWWQVLLEGQLDAQVGMIDYIQRKWDLALPRLKNGQLRNWAAQVCIACIYWRKGNKDEADVWFDKARNTGRKEPMASVVWAVLLHRDGRRDKALEVLAEAVKRNPDSPLLKDVQATIANKRKVNVKKLPQTWYQFFPEDLGQQAVMRGRRDGGPGPGAGFPAPKPNRRMYRGR